MLILSRSSIQSTQPLVSRLVVTPVSDALNGTEVKCADEMIATMSLTTVIHGLLSADTGRLQCLEYRYESFNGDP